VAENAHIFTGDSKPLAVAGEWLNAKSVRCLKRVKAIAGQRKLAWFEDRERILDVGPIALLGNDRN
jgi:hypothetical protein